MNDRRWVLGRRLVYYTLVYLFVSNAAVVYVAVIDGADTPTLIAILRENNTLLSLTLGVVFGGKALKEYLPKRG